MKTDLNHSEDFSCGYLERLPKFKIMIIGKNINILLFLLYEENLAQANQGNIKISVFRY